MVRVLGRALGLDPQEVVRECRLVPEGIQAQVEAVFAEVTRHELIFCQAACCREGHHSGACRHIRKDWRLVNMVEDKVHPNTRPSGGMESQEKTYVVQRR
mmetsp:Transcript_82854/g.130568  ORF Transcript_82854/g.130568 Transcript_82854/m.130568 type:complete len:100 (-) Transcript_82854:210-509(-)